MQLVNLMAAARYLDTRLVRHAAAQHAHGARHHLVHARDHVAERPAATSARNRLCKIK